MSTSPAVCPLCAQVHALNPQELPESLPCEGCGVTLQPRAHGAAVLLEPQKAGPPTEKPEVEALLAQADQERKPNRAYAHIQKALEIDPNSFAANRALLYHGRLHEAIKRPGDYSVIKCYLLNVFEDPASYTAQKLDERIKELFFDPLLARTATLSGDEAGFLPTYLRHLAREYMRVFVRGRNTVSRGAFGFSRSADTVRQRCEQIVAHMVRNVSAEPRLTEEQRELVSEALAYGLDATN
ncbi:MAG: hypothetical protein FWD25_01095 [Clostridia bacterium]|nr:hypothetical protein [Clostridia bacterium]